MVIDSFDGPFRFLSNFYPHPFQFRGFDCATSEHVFAGVKTTDREWIGRILAAPTPQAAKQLGRRAPLRPNWDRDRVLYMRAILHAKFTSDPDLTQRLLDTGDALLIEGNTWGDDYWGRVLRPGLATAVGHNWLGRSLMRLRSELAGHDSQRWVRVAATGHREHLIDADLHPWVRDELARLAMKLRDEHDTQLGLSGLATGADLWWADAAATAGLDLWGYQPFPEQTTTTDWNSARRAHHSEICEQLSRHVLVAHSGHDRNRAFDYRNQVLIGDADAVICILDPTRGRGGTVNALRRYCSGMPVITIDLAERTTRFTPSYSLAPAA
ncbi:MULTISPECIES: NADAR family protein [Nocardia]|uniref:NADAR family protein n=1 Tax=Nocardia TaxID=1817 RepID=UPI00130099C5|nr:MULTISPECIES: NADAR family protein [Nocardia]